MALQEKISRVQHKNVQAFFKKKNVIGMGQGFKYTAGKRTADVCLVVLVEKKEALAQLSKDDLIPANINGVQTDVKAVGKIIAHQTRTSRWRPAPGGISIGHYLITAGTLGAWVKDKKTGKKFILSNNHVMANSNDGFKGDAIIQPGAYDGGKNPQDVIATLERFIRIEMQSSDDGDDGDGGDCSIAKATAATLNFLAKLVGSSHRVYTKKITQTANLVDAALAVPTDQSVIDDRIIDIGKIEGIKPAELGMKVRKSGRTTGTTEGTIETLDAVVNVGYDSNKVARFEHQILTTNMSSPGDSGSLLVDGTENKAVGLLFAGSDQVTVHSPIATVMELLEFEI